MRQLGRYVVVQSLITKQFDDSEDIRGVMEYISSQYQCSLFSPSFNVMWEIAFETYGLCIDHSLTCRHLGPNEYHGLTCTNSCARTGD